MGRLYLPLLVITAIDELQSGLPILSAPALDPELPGETLVLATTLLTWPVLFGIVIEATLLAATDRVGRKPLLVVGLLTMAAGAILGAHAQGPVALALSLGLWGTASGVACGLGQAALVAKHPSPDRAMARWGLSATVGDLLGVLLVVAAERAGVGWRTLLFGSALLPFCDAILVALVALPSTLNEEEGEEIPFRTALVSALTDKPLFAWLLAATMCTLLDEIVVILASLWLAGLGASPELRGLSMGALALGAVLGLASIERLLHRLSARAVLLSSSVLTTAALLGWLAAGSHPSGVLCALLVGAGVGPMYPLTKAAAYRRCPDRPGLVGALDRMFVPIELVMPALIGLVADRAGLVAAMLLLLLQPLVVGLVAWRAAARGETTEV